MMNVVVLGKDSWKGKGCWTVARLGVEDDCERLQGLAPVRVSGVGTAAEKVEVRILSGCQMHIDDMRCQVILY